MTRLCPVGRSSRRRGFTLVELLIVVAIIALLISILVPSMQRARRLTKRVVCMANLHALSVSVHGYEATFHGALPWEGYAEGDRPIRHLGPWADPSQWFNAIPQFTGYPTYHQMQLADEAGGQTLPRDGARSFFVCPQSTPAVAGREDDLVTDGYFMMWGTDSTGRRLERRKTFWSYGYNTELDAGTEDRHTHEQVVLSHIPRPAESPILVEKLMRPDEFNPPFLTSVAQAAVSWKEFTTRHEGGGLILMLDGHVGYFTRNELLDVDSAPDDYNLPGRIVWNPGGPAN